MASGAGFRGRFRVVGQGDEDVIDDSSRQSPPATLSDLQRMSFAELTRRYRQAERPEGLTDLDGPMAGRLLTLAGPLSRGLARSVTNRVASSDRFPWLGKAFQSWAEDRGSGINRLRLGGERVLFHFETRIDASGVDGEPCVVLDYDHGENPWPIRQIRDELRQVAPDLWFGPGAVRGHIVLFFAVQAPEPPSPS